MVKIKCSILLVLCIMFCAFAQSQNTITGNVTDVKGVPLPGVSVIVKGTNNGVTTDFDGNYSLENLEGGNVLAFSYIGMDTQEVVFNNQATINIKMAESLTDLDEVVVVGYGTMRRSDLTGSISSVAGDALEDQPFSSVDQALQGKVSGITVTQNSGAPGGGVSIRVRGVTTIGGNNEPLYVIDGVPVDGQDNNSSFAFSSLGGGNGQTRVSAMSTINPNDIENVEVLKDASAAAIYGSRAANGVILITTKKGKQGKSKISFDSYTGFQHVTKLVDVMNLQEYATYYNGISEELGNAVPFELQNPGLLGEGTNWQKEIFRNAPIQRHQVSFSGGDKKTKFYTSLSYFDQEGIIINTDFNRYSLRLNLDHSVSDNFKIGNNISLSSTKERITLNDDEAGVISSAVRQTPNIPVRYSDGNFGGPTDNEGVAGIVNPVALSEIRNNRLERVKINGNLYGELKFLKDFTFRSEIGYDYNVSKVSTFLPTYSIGSGDAAATVTESISVKQNSDSFYWIFKNFLNYNKVIDKHSINVMAGMEAQESKFFNLSGQRRAFLTNDITALNAGDPDTATANNGEGTWSLWSYFSRLNYSFDSKYLLTATFRADASSNFGPNNKWGYFPSFSLGWVISNENFLKDNDILSLAKIRVGYGEVGNQGIPGYTYGSTLRNSISIYGTGFSQANLANPDVRWETSKSTNVGVELGFLSNKIKLEVDVYRKLSSDFLFQEPLPTYFGTAGDGGLGLNPPFINLGEMENKGIDVTLNTRNISNENFSWSTTAVVSAYKNELLSVGTPNFDGLPQTFEFNNIITISPLGQPISQFYGHEMIGLFQTEEELLNSPSQGDIDEDNGIWLGDIKWKDQLTVDTDGDGVFDAADGVIDDNDITTIGNPHPDFTFSLSNNLRYKDIDLSVSLTGSYGNDIYNWTRRLTEGLIQPTGNQSVKMLNRYVEGVNTNTDIPRFANGDPNANSRVSSRFIEDGSYLRIQNVTLGYTLPNDVIERINMFDRLRIYTTVQNLYTFTNYSGLDPEVGAFSQNALLMGIDNGRYPIPRTIMLGFNIDF